MELDLSAKGDCKWRGEDPREWSAQEMLPVEDEIDWRSGTIADGLCGEDALAVRGDGNYEGIRGEC
jgi:hypothetical protein